MRKIVVLVALVALAACQPSTASSPTRVTSPPRATATSPATTPPPTTTAPPPATLAVVGDSLSVQALWPATISGHRVVVQAKGGAHLDGPGLGWVRALTPRPEVLVVALGTNDAFWGWGEPDDADLDAMLDAASDVACVVLVTPGSGVGAPDSYPGDADKAAAAMWARAGGRVVVADWGGWAKLVPAWIGPDGLHLSESGRSSFPGVVSTAVSRCP